ncbi:MAG: MBL fold metallo-hydrolase, partial [Chloroflexota bacterium]
MASCKRIGVLCPTIVGLLLLSCAPQAAPTPTSRPAPEPTATARAVAAVKPTVPPAPTPAPAAPATPAAVAKPTAPPSPVPTPAAAEAALQYFGHATFLLTSSGGTKVLIDPLVERVGYNVPTVKGVDIVTVSHEHSDHNNVAMAADSPTVLRGLTDKEWAKIDQTLKGIRIQTVGTFHDDKEGAQRGSNAVFVFEMDGMKVVYLGDLGHLLTPEQVSAIGPVDVLMIPVGGHYTVDAAAATKVVEQLSPRAVLPMHYKTPKTSPSNPITGADDFLEGKTVTRPNSNIYRFSEASLPVTPTVIVLDYE